MPEWHYQEILINDYTTKEPIIIYFRDGVEIIESLFSNPVFANCMETTPYRLFDDTPESRGSSNPVIGDFMSADYAWDYQVCRRLLFNS